MGSLLSFDLSILDGTHHVRAAGRDIGHTTVGSGSL